MHGICSCFECQKLTGSTYFQHGYGAKSAVLRINGESKMWRRTSDTGRWIDSYFCPVCGSSVYSFAEFDPDSICISIGSFEDPSFPLSQYSILERHKHPWVQTPPGCEAMYTQP